MVATRRLVRERSSLPATTLALEPLDRATTARLVGDERATVLHERSGGNPLFLLELTRAAPGELPSTVVEAVRARTEALGEAASILRVAAVLGGNVDVDLVAACTGGSVADVLDALEAAASTRLVVESDRLLQATLSMNGLLRASL